jgi:hypothetical protein
MKVVTAQTSREAALACKRLVWHVERIYAQLDVSVTIFANGRHRRNARTTVLAVTSLTTLYPRNRSRLLEAWLRKTSYRMSIERSFMTRQTVSVLDAALAEVHRLSA